MLAPDSLISPVSSRWSSPMMKQIFSFAIIGGSLTIAYAGLYLLLENWSVFWGNLLALSLTTVANLFLNRKFTFKATDRMGADYFQSFLVFMFTWGLTSLAVYLHGSGHLLPLAPAVLVLVGANLSVTALRFLLMRNWVYLRLK